MFDGLIAFGHSIWSFCDPLSLGLILLSSLVGVLVGALPGLTATMGVALMTTLTIKMPSSQALLVLICTYVGAIYGGSRSAILLNIPGTPASAAACLDGHALARQGNAGRAMGIATTGSVLGTLIGMFFLALFTPILGNLALKFGSYEFFWLALFGVIIAGTLTGDDPLKGWIAGLIGIFTATIGQEAIYAHDRFTFGSRDLAGGAGFNDDFHVFAVEWTPDWVSWQLDGVTWQVVVPKGLPTGGTWVFDHPFFILLNVAVGGNYVGVPDPSVFPQTTLVDYVRVYKSTP